jgi:glycosyltransferase involved in cell wall biosynthesis
MPKVSICLPLYNGEKYLRRAIESVLAQTFTNFELLIADDCSSDSSSKITAEYAARDNRVKAWTNKQNLGHYPNYNACLKAASGKYIKLFAQDDIFKPEMLQEMVAAFERNPGITVVSCARVWVDGDERPIPACDEVARKLTRPYLTDTRMAGSQAIKETLKEQINWLGEPVCQMFLSTAISAGFDEAFNQIGDLDLVYQALQSGDLYFISAPLCLFRRHSESWTMHNLAKLGTYLDWIFLGAKYSRYLEQIDISQEEYCLHFIKNWIRNLECEFNCAQKLGVAERARILQDLCGKVKPFSLFTAARDPAHELKALSAMGLLQSAILEHELRLVHDEIARLSSGDYSIATAEPMIPIRSGIAHALSGIRQTLQERDKEIASLKTTLKEMGESTSWKVTEPLRKLNSRPRKGL